MREDDRHIALDEGNRDEPRAFSLTPPDASTSVIFSSPHSGRYYPDAFRALLRVPIMDLRRVEDAYVDQLFSGVRDLGAGMISAVYARSFVDLNRSETELDSRMFRDGPPDAAGERSPRVEAGLGCIPRIAARGEDIHSRMLSRKEADDRLALAYTPYHTVLSERLDQLHRESGMSVLIDCHSMPSVVAGRRVQPDIVIGTRHGSSCDESLARSVEAEFLRLGYRVLRNVPYAGGFLTQKHGRPLEDRHALQIEINRRLYLDEYSVELKPGFARLRDDLNQIVGKILDWTRQKKAAP